MKKAVSILLCVLLALGCLTPAFALPLPAGDTVEWNGHVYRRVDTSMTWQEAKAYCESQGGYLATVTSLEEQTVLMRLIRHGQKSMYWLGATDEETEGEWRWVTGEPWGFTYSGGFDNAYDNEHYLQMYRDDWGNANGLGRWNDANAENTIPGEEGFFSQEHVGFLCETGEPEGPQSSVPVVYVIGRTPIVDAEGNGIIEENTEFITGVIADTLPDLRTALAVGGRWWDKYFDKLYTAISEKYEDYRLNEEGEIVNGSHNLWTWSEDTLPLTQGDIYTYKFEYDARRDPCEIADDLSAYIAAVKAATGRDTVHLVSRCLGCNIATAYLAEYGWEDVETCVLFASAAKGYAFVGEMFAGRFAFDDDAITRYEEQTYSADNGDELMTELVVSTIVTAHELGLLNAGVKLGQGIFDSVQDRIVPRLLLATYATCPGYWAMVNDENYEAAKAYIFGDEAETTYKTLIEKLDHYHYDVQNKVEDMLLQMRSDGVKINVLCKYGFQTPPFIESANLLSDNRIEVSAQSFGAVTAQTGSTLGDDYPATLPEGAAEYLSPDLQIDGSTALLPDETWYLKNVQHNPFYDTFNLLLLEMCYADAQMTVRTDPDFPQYLVYHDADGSVSPLTTETGEPGGSVFSKGLFGALRRVIRAFFVYARALFRSRLSPLTEIDLKNFDWD